MPRDAVDSRIRELGLAKAGAELKVAAILLTYRCTISCRHCAGEFDAEGIWEVHIDPYDNIQTNCGVILGRADRTSVAEMMARGPAQANFVAQTLSEAGPVGLAELARREHGFQIPPEAGQKCELCYLTRRFLRRHHPEILGPAEAYDEP